MTSTPGNHPQNGAETQQDGVGPAGVRVILADSQAIYRVGMKKIFAIEDDIRVVAQVETLTNLYAALERYPTDVVILEGQLISGTIDAVPELVKQAPHAKLIVQVSESDEANTVELYRRGVRGVVPRSISPDLLIKCVRKIADGETWIDNQSISWVIEAYRSQATALTNPRVQPKLSRKELAIISCITRGMRNKEIAYQIGTTEQVIKNYLRKVYDKLGVSDRLELALYCLHHELLKQYDDTQDPAHIAPSDGCDATTQRQDVTPPSENSIWMQTRRTALAAQSRCIEDPCRACYLSISTSMVNLTSSPIIGRTHLVAEVKVAAEDGSGGREAADGLSSHALLWRGGAIYIQRDGLGHAVQGEVSSHLEFAARVAEPCGLEGDLGVFRDVEEVRGLEVLVSSVIAG